MWRIGCTIWELCSKYWMCVVVWVKRSVNTYFYTALASIVCGLDWWGFGIWTLWGRGYGYQFWSLAWRSSQRAQGAYMANDISSSSVEHHVFRSGISWSLIHIGHLGNDAMNTFARMGAKDMNFIEFVWFSIIICLFDQTPMTFFFWWIINLFWRVCIINSCRTPF